MTKARTAEPRPTGRPCKPVDEKHAERLVIKLTAPQMEAIRAMVAREGYGCPLSVYIRQLLLARAARQEP